MCIDTSSMPADEQPLRPSAHDVARAQLVRTLGQRPSFDRRAAFDAVASLVDLLVAERFTPEAAVIEVKRAIEESTCLTRFEQPTRERVRASLVACVEVALDAARESLGVLPLPSETRASPGQHDASA